MLNYNIIEPSEQIHWSDFVQRVQFNNKLHVTTHLPTKKRDFYKQVA
jgi:hypothetical protein